MLFKRVILFSTALCCAVATYSCLGQEIDHRFAGIDEVLSTAVKKEKVVGHAALIYHDGKVIYRNEWGKQDREKGIPLDRNTIFRIYSMSKPVTSVAAMQLVEQGKLELDAPVSTYLPEFKKLKVLENDKQVVPKREMLVRDLLRHTSGLTYGFFGDTQVDKAYRRKQIMIFDKNVEQMVTKLGELPLLLHPGQRFHYSVSTDVLGRLVEVASEQRFGHYLQSKIFQPLGMNDTFFTVPKDKQRRLAQMYTIQQGDLQVANMMQSYRFLNENDFESGGGGLCSTMDDYLQFCKMLLNKGEMNGKRVLEKTTLKEMFTNQLSEIAEYSPSFQFGLGFRISNRGDYSWGGIAGTRFWVNPDKQLAVLYMTQINPFRGKQLANKFRDAAYQVIDSGSGPK